MAHANLTMATDQGQHNQEDIPRADPQPQNEGTCVISHKRNKGEMSRKDLTGDQKEIFKAKRLSKMLRKSVKSGNAQGVKTYCQELAKIIPGLQLLMRAILDEKENQKVREMLKEAKNQMKQLYHTDKKRTAHGEENDCLSDLEKPTEEEIHTFRSMEAFKALVKSYRRGEGEEINSFHLALESFPQLKLILEPLLQTLISEDDQKKKREAIKNTKRELKKHYSLEGKSKLSKQWKIWAKTQKQERKASRTKLTDGDTEAPLELTVDQIKLFGEIIFFKSIIKAAKKNNASKFDELRAQLEGYSEFKALADLLF